MVNLVNPLTKKSLGLQSRIAKSQANWYKQYSKDTSTTSFTLIWKLPWQNLVPYALGHLKVTFSWKLGSSLECHLGSILKRELLPKMEIISCHPRCYVAKEQQGFPILIESGFASSRFYHLYNLRLKRSGRFGRSTAIWCQNRYEYVNPSEKYNSYVLDGTSHPIPKVLIPSLPNEDNGDKVASIDNCYWEWRPKLNVHYKNSGSENTHSPAVLFLPGFGVGSFHYEKQLKDLGRDYRAFALDFLGQGMSLPLKYPTLAGQNDMWGFGDESETWADELVYSVDLWREQVRDFIAEVISEPVYLVGNSLGGFVALYFAACNPELVKGVTLLNATPFWGFLPNPERSPRLSRLFPWAGTFPLPSGVRKLIKILWLKISNPESIAEILKQVYADHSTNVDDVFSHIIKTTQHPAAAASLASIIFAPRAQLSFNEALSRCQTSNIPICLTYGKEDPWVMPIFGFLVKKRVSDASYYEISPAGHCPHDEVPEVVNFILRGWIRNLESNGSFELPLLDDPKNADYGVAKDLEFSRQGGSKKSVRVQFHGSKFSAWSWLSSQFKPLFYKEMSRSTS